MIIQVKHRFNVVNSQRKSRSTVSKTVPNQAPELRFIIAQIQNGQAVNVLDMRGDKDATLDDVDMRFISSKHNTSETLEAMLQDSQFQTSALEGLGNSQELPLTAQGATPSKKEDETNSVE